MQKLIQLVLMVSMLFVSNLAIAKPTVKPKATPVGFILVIPRDMNAKQLMEFLKQEHVEVTPLEGGDCQVFTKAEKLKLASLEHWYTNGQESNPALWHSFMFSRDPVPVMTMAWLLYTQCCTEVDCTEPDGHDRWDDKSRPTFHKNEGVWVAKKK